jgi:hypothetical protein
MLGGEPSNYEIEKPEELLRKLFERQIGDGPAEISDEFIRYIKDAEE